MPARWELEDLSPDVLRRLAEYNPELRAELHRDKREEQLRVARLNRDRRERENRTERERKERQKEREKEFQLIEEFVQRVVEEGKKTSFDIQYQPVIYYEERSLWKRLMTWLKKRK